MFPSLRPILNKGGAGRYISRAESVERLRPISERHLALLRTYDGVLAGMADGPAKEQIEAMMPYLRTEVAKISETILSLGGTPASGVDQDPAGDIGLSLKERVDALLRAENGFGGTLREEVDAVHHQERTRAILNHNAEASTSRINLLRDVAATLPR